MKNHSDHHGLPRRLLAFYLLFSLLAISTLVAGIIIVNEMSAQRRFEKQCRNLFDEYTRKMTLAFQMNEVPRLETYCEKISLNPNVSNAAVITADSVYLTHSDKQQVGVPHVAANGAITAIDHFTKRRFVDEDGLKATEYACPIGKTDPGKFLVTFEDRTPWLSAIEIVQLLAFVIAVPVGIIAFGGILLYRKAKPVAQIATQLTRFGANPSLGMTDFDEVPVKSSMAAGWNCLVTALSNLQNGDSLDEQLKQVVENRKQDRHETAVNSLPDGIAETDIDGQITFINNAMAALLGVGDKSEMIGRRLDEFLDAAEKEKASEIFDPRAQARQVVAELERKTEFGERVLRLAKHPIAPQSSDPRAGQAWSVRDVTQQKLADKARDEFLNSATHELRTPLANIKAYAETLSLDDLTDVEQQKEFCNIINTEATRLARFIDELLDVSSIEAGSLHANMQRCEVDRLLEDVVSKVKPLMSQKNITLETVFGEKLPELSLDKEKFSTCLVNLLGNAAKYTPNGGHVEFKASVIGNHLQITVADNGIGIADDDLPKIFDKFYRSDDDLVHDETGTGLGLAFASEVAKLHNAEITVESKLREGSKFSLTLAIPKERQNV